MPREHFDITMTPEELHSFLGSFSRLVLATNDRDGGTWGDGVAYHFDGDRVHFRVPTTSRALANIRRDDRVCCVVESHPSGSSYYAIRGALVHGRAEEVPEERVPPDLQDVPDPVNGEVVDGAYFSVGLGDAVSFAFSKIAYRYEDRGDL